MPVLQNFYISHQWLRELKAGGARTYIGVYFRIPDDTWVYAGIYGKPHRKLKLGQAIKEIMELENPLGYELIMTRKVMQSEIIRIKHLPQTIGWRYMPDSHEKAPCACEYCLRGTIKGRRTMERLNGKS